MNYRVFLTEDAEDDLDHFLRYLLFIKKIVRQQKIC